MVVVRMCSGRMRRTNGNDGSRERVVIRMVCCYRLLKIKEWVDERDPHATVIPFSGTLEQKVGH